MEDPIESKDPEGAAAGGGIRLELGRERVVKIAPWPVASSQRRQLRREFALLSMLRLEGLPAPVTLEMRPGRGLCLELERLPGKALDRAVAERADRAPLRALLGVARTLEGLHGAGLVHGDVSPRNVLVERQTEGGQGWLLDLGFSDRVGRRALGGGIRGTPATLAPELRDGEAPTQLSDLYAFGRLLLLAATGRPLAASWTDRPGSAPLQGDLAPEVRSQIRDGAALAELIARACAAQRTRRPATMRTLRLELAAALGEPEDPGGERLWNPLVAGLRPAAEARLLGALRAVARGRGGAIALVGPGGSGKRTLQSLAGIVATALGLALRRVSGARSAAGGPPRRSGAPAVVLLDTGDRARDEALLGALARRRGAAQLAIGIARRPSPDPRVTSVELGPLDRAGIGRLVAATLGTERPPAELIGQLGAGTTRQPAALRAALQEALRAGVLRRDARGGVQVIRAAGPLGEQLSETGAEARHESDPGDAGAALVLAGAGAPVHRLAAGLEWSELARLGRSSSVRTLVAHLGGLAPGQALRWAREQLGADRADELARAVGSAMVDLDAGGPGARNRWAERGAWLLAALRRPELRAETLLAVAESELERGSPRACLLLCRRLLAGLERESQSAARACLLAAAAARRLGRPGIALRLASARAATARPAERRALLREVLEARIESHALDAAEQVAAELVTDVPAGQRSGAEDELLVARLRQLQGRHGEARALAASALARARRGAPRIAARALNVLALVDIATGEGRRARRRLERALRIRAALGDPGGRAACLTHLAELDETQGDRDAARVRLLDALELRLEASDLAAAAVVLERLGRLAAAGRNLAEALDHFREALGLREAARDRAGAAAARHNLGILAAKAGDPAGARRGSRVAAEHFQALGMVSSALAARAHAAACLAALGRREEALREHRRVLADRRGIADSRGIVTSLKHLADLYASAGRPRRSASLLWLASESVGEHRIRGADLLLDACERELDAGRDERALLALHRLQELNPDHHQRLRAEILRARRARESGSPTAIRDADAFATRLRRHGARLSERDLQEAVRLLADHARPELARSLLAEHGASGSEAAREPALLGLARVELELAMGNREAAAEHLGSAKAAADRLDLRRERALARILEAELRPGSPSARRALLDAAAACLGPGSSYPALRARIDTLRANPPRRPGLAADQRLGLLRVAELLGSIDDSRRLLQAILGVVLETLGAERGVVSLRSGTSDDFEVALQRNVEAAGLEDARRISRTILRRAYREGRVLHSSNALEDEDFQSLRSVQLYRIVSFACAPLVVAKRIIGTIYVDRRVDEASFGEGELEFLGGFARIAAVAMERARLYGRLKRQAGTLRREVESIYGLECLVHRSAEMRALIDQARRLAQVDTPLLVGGETGTGKGMLARGIHYSGSRAGGPYGEVDCGAVTEGLAESSLFGHLRGAFTGAVEDRLGAFREADGGTLLLDEVSALSPIIQAKLLRVLENGVVRPVGGDRPLTVDVRILCTTNADLAAEVRAGRFREDLYFRINAVTLQVPALRERRSDVLPLAEHFLRQLSERLERKAPELDREFRRALRAAPWPGNVRQLENLLHRLLVLHPSTTWGAEVLPADDRSAPRAGATERDEMDAVSRAEKRLLLEALTTEHWNRRRASERLGLTHRQVCYRMEKYGIRGPAGGPGRPRKERGGKGA